MHIKTLPVGQLQTNCYIVTDDDTKACVIIDPGDESNLILQYIEDLGLKPKAIFLTHGHYDHTMATDDIVREWSIPVYISNCEITIDTQPSPYHYMPSGDTRFYDDGDEITIDGLSFQIIATPGHTLGSVCIRCEDCLFTGDTLFRDNCGRCDLPGGDLDTMMQSLAKIDRLEGIDEVYPGHMDATTLDRERRFNAYLKRAARGQ